MPTIQIGRFKLRFYSKDVSEPPHVHVIDAGKVAKIWLHPISVEHYRGYNTVELSYILKVTRLNAAAWLERWNDYFDR